MPAITSRQNPIVARFRAAARGESGDLLLDGAHLVGEALAAATRIREAAIVNADAEAERMAERLQRQHIPVATVTTAVMQAISPVRSPSPIVALAERPQPAADRMYTGTPLVVVAIDIQDPGNVGALIRVAEAGGASGVVCAGACADPFGWKALRGAMGSTLRLPVLISHDVRQAIDGARRHRCRIIATLPHGGTPMFASDLRGPVAILIGGEGAGLPAMQIDSADERVNIPMQPPVESLNTAVSAALIVYEARRQRGLAVS